VTPTWVVILVGLLSGAIGSVSTALITISHERGAELRTHMLNAADEFSTQTIAALQSVRNAAGEILKDQTELLDDHTGWFIDEIQPYLDGANDSVDDALSKLARVHLLFGDDSEAGIAATDVTRHLRNLNQALEHRPESIREHEQMSRYSSNFDQVTKFHREFNRAALAALKPPWRRKPSGRGDRAKK
jgi:hypothetical protein